MKRIDIALGERSYSVLLEEGLIGRAGALLASYARGGRLVVVTDAIVWEAQGQRLLESLAAAGIEAKTIVLPAGEETKSWQHLAVLVERLLEEGVERSDHIIAFGGGMIGDITGFAASILKRGCNYVQIPTTLLAQVDSSVGGKTAINVAAGKNMVGSFHQPAAVLIDPSTLDTLPARQIRAGYAEVLKYGLIGNASFFAWCEAEGPTLVAGDAASRLYPIETSIRAKAAVVSLDEREAGERMLLNFGHTFGHALEAETGYSEALLHGEAVALGMALAMRLSVKRGLCPAGDADRLVAHLHEVGLPASLREIGIKAGQALVRHMARDKKQQGGRPRLILSRGIGQAFVDESVALSEVERFLEEQAA